MKLSVDTRMGMMTDVRTRLSGGYMVFYTGVQPASPQVVASGVPVATVQLSSPAGALTSNANGSVTLTLDVPPTLQATATGTVGYVRFKKSDGSTVMDGSVGLASADVIVSSSDFFEGGDVSLEAGSLTL